MKRALDVALAATALLLLSPILGLIAMVIWVQDWHSPFYVAPRAARYDGVFHMVKFRSMRVGADRTGVDSTSATDDRITPIGRLIRRLKLDELPQLWNVLRGDMSMVGPRPQVMREVELYTEVERDLLQVAPGLTDLSSIVFADEGEILAPYADADLAYNQLIRPWKSRLGLLYVEHASMSLDLEIVFLTVWSLLSRESALKRVAALLGRMNGDAGLQAIALRRAPLQPGIPPGAATVVAHR